jgi:hypothetical protein
VLNSVLKALLLYRFTHEYVGKRKEKREKDVNDFLFIFVYISRRPRQLPSRLRAERV